MIHFTVAHHALYAVIPSPVNHLLVCPFYRLLMITIRIRT